MREGTAWVAVASTRSIYDGIAQAYVPVALVVLVLVFGFTAIALVRGARRARRSDDEARPAPGTNERPRLEGAYVVLLAVVTAALVVVSFTHEDRLQASTSAPARVHVDVTAAKWRWRFAYANTGIALENRVVVPAGQPVAFSARSADVLHDFWVPERRFQRQVWPDRVTRWTLTFPRPASYDGVCAWFCGLRHDEMHFVVQAVAPDAFSRFIDARRARGRA